MLFSRVIYKKRVPNIVANFLWVRAENWSYSVGSPIKEVCCSFRTETSRVGTQRCNFREREMWLFLIWGFVCECLVGFDQMWKHLASANSYVCIHKNILCVCVCVCVCVCNFTYIHWHPYIYPSVHTNFLGHCFFSFLSFPLWFECVWERTHTHVRARSPPIYIYIYIYIYGCMYKVIGYNIKIYSKKKDEYLKPVFKFVNSCVILCPSTFQDI